MTAVSLFLYGGYMCYNTIVGQQCPRPKRHIILKNIRSQECIYHSIHKYYGYFTMAVYNSIGFWDKTKFPSICFTCRQSKMYS